MTDEEMIEALERHARAFRGGAADSHFLRTALLTRMAALRAENARMASLRAENTRLRTVVEAARGIRIQTRHNGWLAVSGLVIEEALAPVRTAIAAFDAASSSGGGSQ